MWYWESCFVKEQPKSKCILFIPVEFMKGIVIPVEKDLNSIIVINLPNRSLDIRRSDLLGITGYASPHK